MTQVEFMRAYERHLGTGILAYIAYIRAEAECCAVSGCRKYASWASFRSARSKYLKNKRALRSASP
jgi:hypothetical protein